MSNGIIEQGSELKVEWEHLEEWVRRKVQEFVQGVLEEEMTEFLGRRTSKRRSPIVNALGYRPPAPEAILVTSPLARPACNGGISPGHMASPART